MTLSGRLLDPSILLRCASLIGNDDNVFVWETSLGYLQSLKNIFALQPSYGSILKFERELV